MSTVENTVSSHESTPLADRPESLLKFGSNQRLPVILQAEVAECGLTCLAMVAGFYGFDTDLVNLRSRFSISSHGTNLKQLIEMSGKLNLSTRALKLEVDNLSQLQLPCVLHWDMNHFVVLKEVKRNKAIIHDPAIGERSLTLEEFKKSFTGIALELTPTRTFTKKKEKRTLSLNQFWSKISGLKRSIIQIVILSFLLQIFAIISPYFMQTVVDDVLLRNDDNLLRVLALGFGLLLLIEIGTKALREFVILHVASRLNMQMSANLFRHLIRLPMDYFGKRHMGDIVSRFGSLERVRELLTTGLVTAIVDGVMALITLVVMFFYDVKLTFIVIAVVFLYGVLRWLLYRPFHLLSEESIVASAKENSHFMESVRAIQTIKLFQREGDRQNQWQNKLANVINKNIKLGRWQITYNTLNSLLFGIENILIIYFAATAVMGNIISVGMLYAFISYKGRFIEAIDTLIAQFIEYKMLDIHLNRLADIAFTEPEPIDEQNIDNIIDNVSQQKALIQGKIEVKNLSYQYGETELPVFKDLSFTIEAGETVAITGPSGCGKTTLLKCLMGLITPTTGKILIDGKPLQQINNYRAQIAGVMQDDQLLSGDISDNIACFAPQISPEKVQLCAQLACIHDEILHMPMQYNSLVGDMGSGLSGGQKQRIVLARALYKEPLILFMDEATSHLDVNNESIVNSHIKELNITRVLVAHRPETVASADREINMFNHKIQVKDK